MHNSSSLLQPTETDTDTDTDTHKCTLMNAAWSLEMAATGMRTWSVKRREVKGRERRVSVSTGAPVKNVGSDVEKSRRLL